MLPSHNHTNRMSINIANTDLIIRPELDLAALEIASRAKPDGEFWEGKEHIRVENRVSPGDTRVMQCNLRCQRCKAPTKSGRECSLTTCVGLPYCWIHSKSILKVKISRTSLHTNNNGSRRRLPMLGLFACTRGDQNTIVFKKNEVIGVYSGESLSRSQISARYGTGNRTTAPYTLREKDALCHRGIMAYINTAHETRHPASHSQRVKNMPGYADVLNTWIRNTNGSGYVGSKSNITMYRYRVNSAGLLSYVISATRDIKNGEELLWPFENYIMPDNNITKIKSKGTNLKRAACK